MEYLEKNPEMLSANTEQVKICSKCKKILPLSCFYPRGDDRSRYRSNCKICIRTSSGKIQSDKKYYRTHRQKILKQKHTSYLKKEVKEQRSFYNKRYGELNKEKIQNYSRRPEVRLRVRERVKWRYRYDALFKLKRRLRNRFEEVLKSNWKSGSAISNLGCSIDELKVRLERMFYQNCETGEQMTWANYGLHGWHIDHVIPLCCFDLTDRGDFLEASHWTNLQPMWAKENMGKPRLNYPH